jgi:hypothetical protein
MRDKLLRIKQIAKDGVLFQDYEFEEAVQDDIIDFMLVNKDRLRELIFAYGAEDCRPAQDVSAELETFGRDNLYEGCLIWLG